MQFFVAPRPEYSFNGFQQPQQPSYYPQQPQMPTPMAMTIYEVQKFVENFQREMKELSVIAYAGYQSVEGEVDRARKTLETSLIGQFQTMKTLLASKQVKEVEEAAKGGKDEKKIKECIKEKEEDFNKEIAADVQRTTDCINDATERARQTVNNARNAFTETSVINAMKVRMLAQELESCATQNDYYCTQEKATAINQIIKSTAQEGTQLLERVREAPRQQTIQMMYCRQNFVQDLKEMRAQYSKLVKKCIVSIDIQQSNDDASSDSESDESKIQVKLEAEV